MKFNETKLKGSFVVDIDRLEDERGFFARNYCKEEFKAQGVNFDIMQCNISYNAKKGTLRGMHFQKSPYQEAKLITCIKGSMYDVIIDLRKESTTYCQWFSIELSEKTYKMLYVPKSFAHGFQTLEDNTMVFYQMSEFYHQECAEGVRWNDIKFEIKWPLSEKIISRKDMGYTDFIQ